MGILYQSIYIISGDKVQWYNEYTTLRFHYITNCPWHLSEKRFIRLNKREWAWQRPNTFHPRKYEDIEILYQLSNDKRQIYMIGCPITPKMFNDPERHPFLI